MILVAACTVHPLWGVDPLLLLLHPLWAHFGHPQDVLDPVDVVGFS